MSHFVSVSQTGQEAKTRKIAIKANKEINVGIKHNKHLALQNNKKVHATNINDFLNK